MELRQRLLQVGLVLSLTASVLLLGACTRTGGDPATATPAVRVSPSPSTPPRSASPSVAPASSAPAPSAQPSTPPTATATVPVPTATPAKKAGQKYVVKSGDTLSSIAEEFGVTLDALIAANNIQNPNLLFVGQELIIPAP